MAGHARHYRSSSRLKDKTNPVSATLRQARKECLASKQSCVEAEIKQLCFKGIAPMRLHYLTYGWCFSIVSVRSFFQSRPLGEYFHEHQPLKIPKRSWMHRAVGVIPRSCGMHKSSR